MQYAMLILGINVVLINLQVTKVYFEEGYQDTNVYLLECLAPGHVIPGPAIIMDKLSTILIEPGQLYVEFLAAEITTVNLIANW